MIITITTTDEIITSALSAMAAVDVLVPGQGHIQRSFAFRQLLDDYTKGVLETAWSDKEAEKDA